MTYPALVADALTHLAQRQLFAVVATQSDHKPYASLVAFALTDDFRVLTFATKRGTKKYANMKANPSVAVLLDNRSNDPGDVNTGMAVTATGTVSEAHGEERERLLRLYAEKHASLAVFAAGADTALMKVHVHCYVVVTRFQQVVTLYMTARGLSESPDPEI